jgi:O-antigen ligase
MITHKIKLLCEVKYIFILVACIPLMFYLKIKESNLINISVSDLFLIPIIVSFFFTKKIKVNFPLVKKYLYILLVLAVWIFISYLHSYFNPNIKSKGFINLVIESLKTIIVFIYFIIAILCSDKNYLKDIFLFWSVIAVIYSIGGIIFFLYSNIYGGGNFVAFKSTITDQNLASLYLTVSFYIIVFTKKIVKSKLSIIICNIGLIIIPISIILTVSRGGIIGFFTPLILLFLLGVIFSRKRVLYIKLLITILLFILVFINIDVLLLNQKVTNIFIDKISEIENKSDEFAIRVNLSLAAIDMGKSNFLFGVGKGNYPLNSSAYLSDKIVAKEFGWYKDKIPHNTLAGIFAELGFFGLILYTLIFILIIYNCINNLIKSNNKFTSALIFLMYISIFLQSISLNVENFRGLWFVSGLFLPILKNEKLNRPKIDTKQKKNLVRIVILLFILLLLYIDTGRKVYFPKKVESNQSETKIMLVEENFLDSLKVSFFLKYIPKKLEKDSILTEFVGVDQYGNQTILLGKEYKKVNGNVSFYLKNISDYDSVFLKISCEETSFFITNIHLFDENEILLNFNYPLLERRLFSFLARNNLVREKQKKRIIRSAIGIKMLMWFLGIKYF